MTTIDHSQPAGSDAHPGAPQASPPSGVPSDGRSQPTHRAGLTTRLGLDRFSALYLWIGFFVFFGLTKDAYLTSASLSLTFSEKTIVCVLALAFLVPLVTNTYDLSIGANLGLSLVILFSMNRAGHPMLLAAAVAILACAAVGFVSGYIVVKLNVNSFIATLGMSQVVSAMILLISDNRQITDRLPESFIKFGANRGLFNLPMYFYYMLLIAAVLWFVLEHTPLGRYMFATGGARESARLSGVNTDRLTWASLVASAVIAGLAGFVFAFKTNTFQNSAGPGFLFPAVAAVFFGASQLKGRANVWGTLIAVYALAFGIKGLQLSFAAGTYWIEPIFNGLSLLIAVSLASRHSIVRVRKRAAAKTTVAT
jgi:ribose transport system permease protein